MKTLKNHIAINREQHPPKRLQKNAKAKIITRSPLAALLLFSLLFTLFSCGKPSNNPIPPVVNVSSCVINGDVDQSLGARNFEYDDKGLLTKMNGPNYYYGPFARTINPNKAVDAYPSTTVDGNGNHFSGNITISYYYTGGSGNIYDGNPQFMSQVFVASNPPNNIKTDSLYQFVYDDAKKHLTTVLMQGSGYQDADGFINFRSELNFTYDANDNVAQVKIIYDYSKKTTAPSGDSRIDYKQVSDELLTITYDDKPSPYTAILKYWKFIGADFSGFRAYNLDKLRFWAGRCAIMSKNNPVKITGKLATVGGQPATTINSALTYQYNEKNFPVSVALDGAGINSFTYNCK